MIVHHDSVSLRRVCCKLTGRGFSMLESRFVSFFAHAQRTGCHTGTAMSYPHSSSPFGASDCLHLPQKSFFPLFCRVGAPCKYVPNCYGLRGSPTHKSFLPSVQHVGAPGGETANPALTCHTRVLRAPVGARLALSLSLLCFFYFQVYRAGQTPPAKGSCFCICRKKHAKLGLRVFGYRVAWLTQIDECGTAHIWQCKGHAPLVCAGI